MSPADLNPQIATIGVLLLVAIAALIIADQPSRKRVQSVRVDEEGKS